MADNSSQGSGISLNEAESLDRKKILKCRTSRSLPRHPIQRHYPVRQGGVKRKKRRYPSISGDDGFLVDLKNIVISVLMKLFCRIASLRRSKPVQLVVGSVTIIQ